MTPPDLARLLADALGRELGDPALAGRVAALVQDVALTWMPETADPGRIDTILACSCSNRPNAASGVAPSNGASEAARPVPGPVNAGLADIVAQREIAAELVARRGQGGAVAILLDTARTARSSTSTPTASRARPWRRPAAIRPCSAGSASSRSATLSGAASMSRAIAARTPGHPPPSRCPPPAARSPAAHGPARVSST